MEGEEGEKEEVRGSKKREIKKIFFLKFNN